MKNILYLIKCISIQWKKYLYSIKKYDIEETYLYSIKYLYSMKNIFTLYYYFYV